MVSQWPWSMFLIDNSYLSTIKAHLLKLGFGIINNYHI